MSSSHTLSYDVCGIPLHVDTDVGEVRDHVAMTYAAFADSAHEQTRRVPGEIATGTITVRAKTVDGAVEVSDSAGYRATELIGVHAAAAATLERLVRVITAALARKEMLAVHAAAVDHRGAAVLLAGPSGAGKTTLALGLVARGLPLLSDELAVLAAGSNTVLPYRRSVHIRPGTPELIPALGSLAEEPQVMLGGGIRWSVTPEELERTLPHSLAAAAPLRDLIVIEPATGYASEPRIERESPAASVVELARGAPASEHDLAFVLRRLSIALDSARCARLYPGPFDATLECLLQWLET